MKNSFLSGAVILMTANAISKILGAVLKIPLTYIMHEEGMAIYNTAFNVYMMFLSFVMSGVPFAVQKLTAAACAEGNNTKAEQIIKTALAALVSVGVAGTAALWFGADFFALAMKEEKAAAVIRAISPSVFFVACAEVLKSGFQGKSNMLPTAVSQVTESLIKLAAGYFLALSLIKHGFTAAAAGAGLGVSAGEFSAAAVLIVWHIHSSLGIKARISRKVLKEILSIALPMLCISVICSSISVCDASVLRMSLIRSGLGEDGARFVYGAYTGYVMTVLNLPTGLLATIGVSIIPIISGAAALGDRRRIRQFSRKALRFSALTGTCTAVCIFLFGELILKILFGNTYSTPMLRLAAPSVAFICIMQLSGAILQSMGFIGTAFISSVSVAALKLIFSAVLASRPELNIYGAIIGTNISFLIGMTMNLIFLSLKQKRM